MWRSRHLWLIQRKKENWVQIQEHLPFSSKKKTWERPFGNPCLQSHLSQFIRFITSLPTLTSTHADTQKLFCLQHPEPSMLGWMKRWCRLLAIHTGKGHVRTVYTPYSEGTGTDSTNDASGGGGGCILVSCLRAFRKSSRKHNNTIYICFHRLRTSSQSS